MSLVLGDSIGCSVTVLTLLRPALVPNHSKPSYIRSVGLSKHSMTNMNHSSQKLSGTLETELERQTEPFSLFQSY